jgi:hypothetical protein
VHKQELDDPLILIHDKKVSSLHAVVKVLELALKVHILFPITLFLEAGAHIQRCSFFA